MTQAYSLWNFLVEDAVAPDAAGRLTRFGAAALSGAGVITVFRLPNGGPEGSSRLPSDDAVKAAEWLESWARGLRCKSNEPGPEKPHECAIRKDATELLINLRAVLATAGASEPVDLAIDSIDEFARKFRLEIA